MDGMGILWNINVTATVRISLNEFIQVMQKNQGGWLPPCNETAIRIVNEVDEPNSFRDFQSLLNVQ